MRPKLALLSLLFAAVLLGATAARATPTLTEIGISPGDFPTGLIQASDGNFYGVTHLGRSIVFKLTPSGQFTVLFTAPYDETTNSYPDGNGYLDLVEGPDGYLYIVDGLILRISKSGTDAKVVHNGSSSAMSLASDGNFYGADSNGTFRFSTDGTYSPLYQTGSNGFIVQSFSKQATDGNFYGICYQYGTGYHVCRATTRGQVTSIFNYPNARWPAAYFLSQGSDGFLYGSALAGYSSQVIFQLSLSGSYRELYQSKTCTAKTGCSRVIQASDGNLWITNPTGDSVLSITPTGGALLQTVPFGSHGHPQILIQGSNGILYGTTGEPCPCYYDPGSLFMIDAGLPPPK